MPLEAPCSVMPEALTVCSPAPPFLKMPEFLEVVGEITPPRTFNCPVMATVWLPPGAVLMICATPNPPGTCRFMPPAVAVTL